jgi:uncharacterized integral membrane protein
MRRLISVTGRYSGPKLREGTIIALGLLMLYGVLSRQNQDFVNLCAVIGAISVPAIVAHFWKD